ncbi:hypothetical protein ZHAS_00011775 [Anopheles sinensis]|uniref:Uncharacterized protein n=1 Tax=Anopheles sinensis TaxID=74873 RepID=A0A084W154_ANOSI|nr:hypothetical protein ZHAS_00011775 [Anopheles sinensis]
MYRKAAAATVATGLKRIGWFHKKGTGWAERFRMVCPTVGRRGGAPSKYGIFEP